MKKSKKISLLALISILVIGGIMFTIDYYRMSKNLPDLFSTWGKSYTSPTATEGSSTGTAEYLFNFKTLYIGDNSAVGRLLDSLEIRNYGQYTFELQTSKKPYALIINYNKVEGWGNILNNPQTTIEKSAILLALIDNAEEIHWVLPDTKTIHKITNKDLLADYGTIKDYGKSVDDFRELLIKLGYDEENKPITMNISRLTNKGLTLTIKNHMNNKYQYGEPYSLELKENDKWNSVEPIKDNCAFIAIAYSLKAKQETEIKVNWEYCYGKLPAGQYRITKTFTHVKSNSSNFELRYGKKYYISAEYLLK